MAPNFWPILILLATVVAATSATSSDGHPPHNDNVTSHDYGTCREHDDVCGEDSKNDVVVPNEESVVSSLAGEERGMQVHEFNRESDQFMMDSETSHRMLVQRRQRYITYRALAANNIPCGWKEGRYYDCNEHERANLYRRGCTAATGCYRWTH